MCSGAPLTHKTHDWEFSLWLFFLSPSFPCLFFPDKQPIPLIHIIHTNFVGKIYTSLFAPKQLQVHSSKNEHLQRNRMLSGTMEKWTHKHLQYKVVCTINKGITDNRKPFSQQIKISESSRMHSKNSTTKSNPVEMGSCVWYNRGCFWQCLLEALQ